ncbi:MAG: DNA-directed RNA polymerase subunit alpha [Candidatus Paceibacterota bacterium]
MSNTKILVPSKPKVIKEDAISGIYEIDGLYPGYGHTLGNSLRRIVLSSIEGAAITSIKIKGVSHEFSSIKGVKEDVVAIILNLKKVRFSMLTDEPQLLRLHVKGEKKVTAGDITLPGQVEMMTPDHFIAEITEKGVELDMEIYIEKGLGYLAKEVIQKDRVEIGSIALDAIFSPIRRVGYDVENMRVGNRTDFNKLKIFIETDGSITPREALEKSIRISIEQLKAIVGFIEEEEEIVSKPEEKSSVNKEEVDEMMKTRIESADMSARTINALISANIRTVGGLARKKEKDLSEIDGLGTKGIKEIKTMLKGLGMELK